MLNHLPQPIQHPIDIKHLSLIHSNFLIYSRSIITATNPIHHLCHAALAHYLICTCSILPVLSDQSLVSTSLCPTSLNLFYKNPLLSSLPSVTLCVLLCVPLIAFHCSSPVLSFTIVYSGKLIVICVMLLQLVEVHALYLLVHLFLIVSLLFMSYLDSSI